MTDYGLQAAFFLHEKGAVRLSGKPSDTAEREQERLSPKYKSFTNLMDWSLCLNIIMT